MSQEGITFWVHKLLTNLYCNRTWWLTFGFHGWVRQSLLWFANTNCVIGSEDGRSQSQVMKRCVLSSWTAVVFICIVYLFLANYFSKAERGNGQMCLFCRQTLLRWYLYTDFIWKWGSAISVCGRDAVTISRWFPCDSIMPVWVGHYIGLAKKIC